MSIYNILFSIDDAAADDLENTYNEKDSSDDDNDDSDDEEEEEAPAEVHKPANTRGGLFTENFIIRFFVYRLVEATFCYTK